MSSENLEMNQVEADRAGSGATPDDQREKAGYSACSPMMAEMMRGCPCRSFAERHRVGFFLCAAGCGFAILIFQLGWLLGVIAFFRSL